MILRSLSSCTKLMKIEKILFVGIGGGNDVFSGLLAAMSLWNIGWRWRVCDFAGVLSPFHAYSGMQEYFHIHHSGKHVVIGSDSQRFIRRKHSLEKIGFVDATVSNMLQNSLMFRGSKVLGLSLEGGTVELAKTFRGLSNDYNYIVLVDLGGDCFYRGAEDKHILSPMFDAITLKAFIDSKARGILFEAGPGSDGEMEPDVLEQLLTGPDLNAEICPLDSHIMDQWSKMYTDWIQPVRRGHTVPNTIAAFHSTEEIMTVKHQARAHIGTLKKFWQFDQRIKTSLCKKFYLIDPKKIRNPFAIQCADPVSWFTGTQACIVRTNCEANLEYVKSGDDILQFVTPSPLFYGSDKAELINVALESLEGGQYDGAMMFDAEWSFFKNKWPNLVETNGPDDLTKHGMTCLRRATKV